MGSRSVVPTGGKIGLRARDTITMDLKVIREMSVIFKQELHCIMRLVIAVVILGLPTAALAQKPAARPCPAGNYTYKIYESTVGNEIGSVTFLCIHDGDKLTVKIRQRIDVPGYELCSDRGESWSKGEIKEFTSNSDEGGFFSFCSPNPTSSMPLELKLTRDAQGVWWRHDGTKSQKLEGAEDCPVTPNSMPANFWNPDLIVDLGEDKKGIRAIDPISALPACWDTKGKQENGIQPTIEVCGRTLKAEEYKKYELVGRDGDERTVWYGPDGSWIKMVTKGTCGGATFIRVDCPEDGFGPNKAEYLDSRGPKFCPLS